MSTSTQTKSPFKSSDCPLPRGSLLNPKREDIVFFVEEFSDRLRTLVRSPNLDTAALESTVTKLRVVYEGMNRHSVHSFRKGVLAGIDLPSEVTLDTTLEEARKAVKSLRTSSGKPLSLEQDLKAIERISKRMTIRSLFSWIPEKSREIVSLTLDSLSPSTKLGLKLVGTAAIFGATALIGSPTAFIVGGAAFTFAMWRTVSHIRWSSSFPYKVKPENHYNGK